MCESEKTNKTIFSIEIDVKINHKVFIFTCDWVALFNWMSNGNHRFESHIISQHENMNSITTIMKREKNPAQLSVLKRETNTCNSCSKSMRGFNSKALNVNWLLPLINTVFNGYSLPQVGHCVYTAIGIVFLFLAACALVSWITHMYDGHFNRFSWGFVSMLWMSRWNLQNAALHIRLPTFVKKTFLNFNRIRWLR